MSTHCFTGRLFLFTAITHLVLLGSMTIGQEGVSNLAMPLIKKLEDRDPAGACRLIPEDLRDKRLYLFQSNDDYDTSDSVKLHIVTSNGGSYTGLLPCLFILQTGEASITEIEVTWSGGEDPIKYTFNSPDSGKGLWRAFVPSRHQVGVTEIVAKYVHSLRCPTEIDEPPTKPKGGKKWHWYGTRASIVLATGGIAYLLWIRRPHDQPPPPPAMLPDPPDYPARP